MTTPQTKPATPRKESPLTVDLKEQVRQRLAGWELPPELPVYTAHPTHCPRCVPAARGVGGRLFVARDWHGYTATCLACGYEAAYRLKKGG